VGGGYSPPELAVSLPESELFTPLSSWSRPRSAESIGSAVAGGASVGTTDGVVFDGPAVASTGGIGVGAEAVATAAGVAWTAMEEPAVVPAPPLFLAQPTAAEPMRSAVAASSATEPGRFTFVHLPVCRP
jgi:hypothetical protein